MPGTALPRGNATAPCNWPVSYANCVTPPFTEDDGSQTDQDQTDQALFESIATTYLWEWTGRRYGTCDELIRPCRRGCDQLPTFFQESPYIRAYGLVTGSIAGAGLSNGWFPFLMADGSYGVLGCGACGLTDGCSCGYVSVMRLPGPVDSVTQILIDGAVFPTTSYRVDGPKIVRTDGFEWPYCQNMALPPTEVGTWTIEYQRGLPVPDGGQVAAGILASELYKAASNDGTCQLPQRVQTITRQGVTMAMLTDFTSSLDQGYTGIWMVDSWIASVTRPHMSALVVSPDFRRPGRMGNGNRS